LLASGRVTGSVEAAALRKTKRPQGQWVLRNSGKPLFFPAGRKSIIMAKIKPMAVKNPQASAMYDVMNAALTKQMNQFSAGSIIKGTISGVKGNEVLVDIGYKSEGTVPASEFKAEEPPKVGDVINVLLIELESDGGMVVLSKSRADDKLRWEAMLTKYTEGGIVTGIIRSKVRGGLIVDVDGVDAFLPGSQVDVTPVHDPDPFINTTCEFKVIKISNERHNIIVSRR